MMDSLGEMMQTVNPMELAMEGLKEIQKRFYGQYPAHPMEERYGFATPSTMKPTQWFCKVLTLHFEFLYRFCSSLISSEKNICC